MTPAVTINAKIAAPANRQPGRPVAAPAGHAAATTSSGASRASSVARPTTTPASTAATPT